MAEAKKRREVVYDYRNTSGNGVNWMWWNVKDDPHVSIHKVVESYKIAQDSRRSRSIKYLRLYQDKAIDGFEADLYNRSNKHEDDANRVTLNVVKACVDTAQSKIAKNRPRPIFLTQRDFIKKQRAKKLTQYIDGVFDPGSSNVYGRSQSAFRDAGIFGTGCVKMYRDQGQIKSERVFQGDIYVDEREAIYGTPSHLHQTRYVHKDVLLDKYGRKKDAKSREIASAIMSAKGLSVNDGSDQSTSDLILFIESWKLSSGRGEYDGRHVMSINNCTIIDEPWDDFYPFAFFHWTPPLFGFWGMGIAEELVGIQREINKILRNIQRSIHLFCVPRVLVERNSKIVTSHIQNIIGSIIKYTNQPPKFDTPAGLSPEVYQHLDRLYNRAFESTGISQMAATSRKPAGLNSGVALREFSDNETERFMTTAQRYENFHLELARIAIRLESEAHKNGENPEVKVTGKRFMQTIKWSDIDLDESQYTMKVYPASLLPTLPAAKLDRVQELAQAGLLPKEWLMALLDFPDIERFTGLETAALDDIEDAIGSILEDGVYLAPEPEMNLELGRKMAHMQYLRGRVEKVPEDRLQMLLDFKDACQDLIDQTQAQAAPPAQPPASPAPQPDPTAAPTEAVPIPA